MSAYELEVLRVSTRAGRRLYCRRLNGLYFYFVRNLQVKGKNWIATVPGNGFFAILRRYGPTQAYFDKS